MNLYQIIYNIVICPQREKVFFDFRKRFLKTQDTQDTQDKTTTHDKVSNKICPVLLYPTSDTQDSERFYLLSISENNAMRI